jgi:hypothetical protein
MNSSRIYRMTRDVNTVPSTQHYGCLGSPAQRPAQKPGAAVKSGFRSRARLSFR